MQFSNIALAALLTAVQAIPTTVTDGTSKLGARSLTQCTEYTVFNRTTSNSPLVADCQKMARNIDNGNGIWTVFNKEGVQHPAAWSGSCFFSVTVPPGTQGGDRYAYIGNGDIIDLVNRAIESFGKDGKIGADGAMHCVGSDETGVDIMWGISRAAGCSTD
jgi:hypothetical protein